MRPEEIAEAFGAVAGRALDPSEIGSEHLAPGARVVAAMSGGVDSAVAAAMLRGAGLDVVGVSMRLGTSSARADGHRGCCSLDDFDDARRAAERLGIPHYVVDLRDVFQEKVIDRFVAGYAEGRTPNPCTLCNRDVKFDAFWDYAETVGAVAVGTGHYARIRRQDGVFALYAGRDASKDQSYFLFTLGQQELGRTLFPVGRLEKPEVRRVAEALSLPVANKPESQDICFVAGERYSDFVERELDPQQRRPGVLQDAGGHEIGRHDGIHQFTVGQRRGLGGGASEPRFVTAIDGDTGTVVVGTRTDLDRDGLVVRDVRWTDAPRPGRASVRLRHRHEPVSCTVHVDGETARVEFDQPTPGVTPGQAAVWYDGERVLGGGWIAH
ncbi:MAG: tRNA 2-thiouridine(34) synthase MnmA [Candidatus Binatia bacterium]|nr:tRNA 2-thiouridine(34) synthase MnmA [Candidatus Binatia bacterium]